MPLILAVIVLVVGIVGLIGTALTDGKVDYCYIQEIGGNFILQGHRPWRGAVRMGDYKSVEEAANAAKAAECQLNK